MYRLRSDIVVPALLEPHLTGVFHTNFPSSAFTIVLEIRAYNVEMQDSKLY